MEKDEVKNIKTYTKKDYEMWVLRELISNLPVYAKSIAYDALSVGFRSSLLEYVGNYTGDFGELRENLEEDFGKTLEEWLKEIEQSKLIAEDNIAESYEGKDGWDKFC